MHPQVSYAIPIRTGTTASVRPYICTRMKLEIFPYRFRDKANAAELRRRGSGVIELKGAKALYDLYMSGASFRLMPDSPVDAVVFDLDELSAEETDILDGYVADNAFVVKSPSAVLGIPGKENRRKVFYGLPREYSYTEYAQAYGDAFAQFALEAGLYAITGDACMGLPGQVTFGRPDPGMETRALKLDISGLGNMRIQMPLSRYAAKELFGIDKKAMLPSVEYLYEGKAERWERHTIIWKKIIPTAFAWYHFFKTTTEKRWGLADNYFEFNDCVRAIGREISRLGVPPEGVEEVIRGNLSTAYERFNAPPLVPYFPRSGKAGPAYWDSLPPARKKEIIRRQNLAAKERRRMKRRLYGTKKAVRKSKFRIRTLEDLERLWKEKGISRPYYYLRRKEFLGKGPART